MIHNRPINIMLVEDYEATLKGVRGVLETRPSFRVVAEAAGMEDALRKAQDNAVDPGNAVDLVVTDLQMPQDLINGIELTKRLRANFPELLVVIYTMHDEEEFVLQAIEAGAHGYVLKCEPIINLMNAISKVIQGLHVFPPIVCLEKLLTLTERQVFWYLGDGKSNTYIAEELSLRVHTVQDYRSKIWQKIKVVVPEQDGNNTLIHHATKYRMRCPRPSR